MDALHTIARNLTKKRQTVSCAESCTGGMLAAAFTSVAGSSQWFDQSFVTYSNKAKEDRLGVLPETLLEYGAVSRQTVYEMARGAQIAAQADYAVGISGIAGPGGGSESKPVGTVWFGFAFPGGSCEEIRRFDGNRESVRAQAVAFALERLAGLIENGSDAV
ncbi:CinA family protein [Neisseria meningitidis]|nr:CinA family protein [Neisseria meningitidis]MCL5866945.1 CinA family protein [Neisseria meningitidis]MCL5871010.1 CinA family protein [Neisseria meningitidis]MCL6114749.1 CinA family protein [Neisseria meningitidis]